MIEKLRNVFTFRGNMMYDAFVWMLFNSFFILFTFSVFFMYLLLLSSFSLPHIFIIPLIALGLLIYGYKMWRKYFINMYPLYIDKPLHIKLFLLTLSALTFIIPMYVLKGQTIGVNPLLLAPIYFAMLYYALMNFVFIATGIVTLKAYKF